MTLNVNEISSRHLKQTAGSTASRELHTTELKKGTLNSHTDI